MRELMAGVSGSTQRRCAACQAAAHTPKLSTHPRPETCGNSVGILCWNSGWNYAGLLLPAAPPHPMIHHVTLAHSLLPLLKVVGVQRPLILRQLPAGSRRQAAGGETRFRAQGRAGAQPGACAATASSTCKVNALARPAGRAAGRQAGRQQSPTASVCAILRLAGLCMPMGRACAGCTGHPAHCPACLSACTTGSLPMRLLRSSEYTACGQGVCMCTGKWQGCYVCVLGLRRQPTLCTGQPRPARGRYTASGQARPGAAACAGSSERGNTS